MFLCVITRENKRKIKEIEKALKYELKDVKWRSWIKLPRIWKCSYFSLTIGNGQSGLIPIKDEKGGLISDKESIEERWAENVFNHEVVANIEFFFFLIRK